MRNKIGYNITTLLSQHVLAQARCRLRLRAEKSSSLQVLHAIYLVDAGKFLPTALTRTNCHNITLIITRYRLAAKHCLDLEASAAGLPHLQRQLFVRDPEDQSLFVGILYVQQSP